MATQAVSAVAGIAPQQAAPAQSAKHSGFASGGVRVPRVAGFANGSARVKHVTRAEATPQVSAARRTKRWPSGLTPPTRRIRERHHRQTDVTESAHSYILLS